MDEIELQASDKLSPSPGRGGRPTFVIGALVRRSGNRLNLWQPPTDHYETEDEYVVRMEIAGMENSEFRISYEDRALMIQGIRKELGGVRAFRQMEIRFGEFVSYVEMAGPVDVDAIQAEYEDGFLTVRLPKMKPSRIDIQP